MTRYFAMWSDTPFAEADKQWRESVLQSGLACPRCGNLLPEKKIGRAVLAKRPGDYPITSLGPAPIVWVVREDLMAALEAPGMGEAGPIFLASGETLKGFRFLVAEELLARGGTESNIAGVCDYCGWLRYWPQPYSVGSYLLRCNISDPRPVYGGIGGLALREDVYNRVVAQNFPGLNFYELPIRDEPEDGLPADLKPYLTPEEQAAMGDILWRDANKDRRTDHGGQWLPWKIQRNVLNRRPGPGGKESG